MENFTLSSTNPNKTHGGGGGCLCSQTEAADCKPPYVIFGGDELCSPASPIPVACRTCISQALKKMDSIDVLPRAGDPLEARRELAPDALNKVQKVVTEEWLPTADDLKPESKGTETDLKEIPKI